MTVRIVECLGVCLGAGAILLAFASAKGRPRESSAEPVDTERRAFLNRVLVGAIALFAVVLGGGSIATLWPNDRRESKVVAGKRDDLLYQIDLYKRPVYNIEGKFYLVKYSSRDPNNRYVRAGVVAGGLMALSQKCSHLGCRVPFCSTSQWFECPCHGAQFNMAGEVRRGPAPAGLWRFPIEITADGSVVVDTRLRTAQPPWGTDTTNQQPMGAFCVPT